MRSDAAIFEAENRVGDGFALKQIALTCGNTGGQGRDRTGDLPLFRRTLVPTELPGRMGTRILVPIAFYCDPDGTRTRDLRRDRAAR
jgi:hypothetical protein